MRIFSLISLCAACLILNGCQSVKETLFLLQEELTFDGQSGSAPEKQQTALKPAEMLRIGMLLPLTGKSEKVGKDLKNAALMALFDTSNNRLVLQFYDTTGTPQGARDAAELAIKQGAELIIGPVFAPELRAMRSKAHSADIGILTFSSDPSNVGKGVFTVSTLTSQQVEHIVSFACSKGYKRFAVTGPDNMAGDIIALAAKNAVDKCGGMITKAVFYDPKTDNLLPVVSEIMPRMIEDLEKEREEYVQNLQTVLDDESTEKKRVKVKTKTTVDGKEEIQMVDTVMTAQELTDYIEQVKSEELIRDPFEFDALLVPEEGSRLRSFGALFSYFDVPSEIKILGTSQWAQSHPERESGLIGGWFAGMPSTGFKNFSNRYQKLYNEKPSRIASQAYDAVALASVLAQTGDFSFEQLTNTAGFNGVDGLFRLLENGLSERGLTVFGVEKKGFVTLEPPPETFNVAPDVTKEAYIEDFRHAPELITLPPEETAETTETTEETVQETPALTADAVKTETTVTQAVP